MKKRTSAIANLSEIEPSKKPKRKRYNSVNSLKYIENLKEYEKKEIILGKESENCGNYKLYSEITIRKVKARLYQSYKMGCPGFVYTLQGIKHSYDSKSKKWEILLTCTPYFQPNSFKCNQDQDHKEDYIYFQKNHPGDANLYEIDFLDECTIGVEEANNICPYKINASQISNNEVVEKISKKKKAPKPSAEVILECKSKSTKNKLIKSQMYYRCEKLPGLGKICYVHQITKRGDIEYIDISRYITNEEYTNLPNDAQLLISALTAQMKKYKSVVLLDRSRGEIKLEDLEGNFIKCYIEKEKYKVDISSYCLLLIGSYNEESKIFTAECDDAEHKKRKPQLNQSEVFKVTKQNNHDITEKEIKKMQTDLEADIKRSTLKCKVPISHIKTLYQLALQNLDYNYESANLIGRESELHNILEFIYAPQNKKIESNFLYISGMPGAGKTFTLGHALNQAQKSGIKVANINAYGKKSRKIIKLVYRSFFKRNRKSYDPFSKLREYFSQENSFTHIISIDEIDSISSKELNKLLYNFAEWTNLSHNLLIIGVSNRQAYIRLDADSKIISRLGNFEIVFLPYNATQMIQILNDRKYISEVFTEEAIKYISLKVANRGGDIRKALDMCEASLTSITNKEVSKASINYEIVREVYSSKFSPFLHYIKNASIYDKVLIITLSFVSKSNNAVSCKDILELFNQHLDKYSMKIVTHHEFHETLSRYYRQGLVMADNESIGTIQIPTDDLKEALKEDTTCSQLLNII